METNKLYSISIKNRKEKVVGIIEQEGEEWILLKAIFTDYIMDGRKLICKKYISSINRSEKDIFKENVLRSAKKWDNYREIKIPLSTDLLFDFLNKEQKVFQISLRDESVCYLGKIEKLLGKSFYLKPLTPRGKWQEENLLFRIGSVRIIDIDTDYISSLLAYNSQNTFE